jgi:hypothetical protein
VIRHAVLIAAVLLPSIVHAQTEPGPPGPYVIDLRGAMLGMPNAIEFYPSLPVDATIPGRAFGLEVGAHMLPWQLGSARVGVGASVLVVRGLVGPPDVSATATALAPQVSLNFGTADGWSYVGGGVGPGRIRTRVSGDPDVTAETGSVSTFNVGGGVRWFLNSRMAVGFDVRFYRFGASSSLGSPATTRTALSVGMSVR